MNVCKHCGSEVFEVWIGPDTGWVSVFSEDTTCGTGVHSPEH